MHTRKAALVGCQQGPWVNTSRMRGLKLEVKGEAHVRVAQSFSDGNDRAESDFHGSGLHRLLDAEWARVSIIDGEPASVLCFLTTAP